jgi:hypothetical protein
MTEFMAGVASGWKIISGKRSKQKKAVDQQLQLSFSTIP